jgi:hypothetical protein
MNLKGVVGESMSQSLPILARFVNNFKEKKGRVLSGPALVAQIARLDPDYFAGLTTRGGGR